MKRCGFLFVTVVVLPFCSLADFGSIPHKKGATVTEPNQDAIIAWNGRTQLLYIQTTLKASEETKVLEVMPLPNRPVVKEAQKGVFKRAAFLMPPPAPKSDAASPFGGPPAAVVKEHLVIGAHDLKVVQLMNAAAFSKWIQNEYDGIEVPEALLKVIGEYAADGFEWFLFDEVDLDLNEKKKTPLQIQFASDHLYYPMRITRTEKGITEVNLTVITNVLFNADDCVGIPREQIQIPTKPREIPGNKVYFIDPPIFNLLGGPEKARIRNWRIRGKIDEFDKDLLIRNPVR